MTREAWTSSETIQRTGSGIATQPDMSIATPAVRPIRQPDGPRERDRSARSVSTTLIASWGTDSYEQLVEIGTIELASIDVRVAREDDDNKGARMREDVIKRLASDRIAECTCGTVINMGAHHAQKAHLMGTDQEWLGDYLTHARDAGEESVIVVAFGSARTDLEPGAGGTPWNILESASPDNELFRSLAETVPAQSVFLPLDDPLFAERTTAFNSEDVIYVTRLHEQFDAIIQYDLAHRMPIN